MSLIHHRARPCVLTIAGSDSGGGAGIQADLKTFAAHGVHGLSALAAVTAQNTRAVTSVHAVPIRELGHQLDAVFDDFRVAAIKIGMLGSAAAVRAVARAIAARRPANVVLDPVMIATSGAMLLPPAAVKALRDELMPLATLVTPNVPEAQALTGLRIADAAGLEAAAYALREMTDAAALVKGGHLARGPILDVLLDDDGVMRTTHPRLKLSAHGTGCTLASAVAARLAKRTPLRGAVAGAIAYVAGALAHGYRPGRGRLVVLDHLWELA
ncbi:MAG TPA: bifunctional hydroxymethylpyrimidine kinase/phosphomethylpyrimidine kinase [Candidatus Saccharimonadia bacterium]|nr:bifunctional hydroxymethylpyrimidine kinase/phosphomethylpyrimidine kinase [Candidatus Saccharimonadia bacterium]